VLPPPSKLAPMTDTQFRKLALALPGVEPGSHFGSPDFRVK
jgi:hypothetical protein